eukprot:Em0023g139a
MPGCRGQFLLLSLVLPASADKPYYAIPVAIFILVAILLVVCVTLWVVPYCVDHQRKRKRQTDAAKGANLDDDDDEISTAYKEKTVEAAEDEGKSNPYISRPQVNYPPLPEKEAVDFADDVQPNPTYATNTPYFFPVNPKPQPSPVYPRTDQYGVSSQVTPGEETEL